MRLFQDFDKKLKSSFDQKGAAQFYYDSNTVISPRDTYRIAYAFQYWSAYAGDRLWQLHHLPYEETIELFNELWHFLAIGYPLCALFEVLKETVTHIRHEEYLVFDEDPVSDWVGSLVGMFPRWWSDCDQFRYLHGILNFPCKLYLERTDLQEAGLHDWFSHEDWLRTLPPVESLDCYPDLCQIIDRWMGSWSPSDLRDGFFTGGSTADAGRDLYAKIHHSAISEDLALLLIRERPDLLANGPSFVVEGYSFYSKWVQVPKSATSLREISMETAALNYWQTALDESLRRQFRKTVLGRLLNHERQHVNRMLAVQGSRDGKLATVDFSKASDSVRFSHLTLFPWPLRSWLYATRSPATLIGEDLVFIEKYAAMGSRLTFDVMQVILAASGDLAEQRVGIPLKDRQLSVVGDDVIIEVAALEEFLSIVTELGFIVNKNKSYYDGNFRESCGAFAFKGVDVTEPALPRQPLPDGNDFNSAEMQWACALADRAWLADAPFLRYVVMQPALKAGTPWFRDMSVKDAARILEGTPMEEWCELGYYSMFSPAPTNWRVRRRASRFPKPDYGFGEMKLLCGRHKTSQPYDDDQLYEMWLYINRNRTADSSLSERSLAGLGVGQIVLRPYDLWKTKSY